ncbi:MAG TPA: hypothetical protein ENI23_12570 [bacterium]|nr:hypothetical protein [bacterium]
MTKLKVEIELCCDECGTKLEGTSILDNSIEVKPCSECMKNEYEEGYEIGVGDLEQQKVEEKDGHTE